MSLWPALVEPPGLVRKNSPGQRGLYRGLAPVAILKSKLPRDTNLLLP